MRAERGEIPRSARVVVETTGLADPTPIVGTIAKNGLLRSCFHLSAVETTVDACLGDRTLSAQPEAMKQAAVAEWPFEPHASKVVVITRGLEREMVDAIRENLRRLVKRGPLTGLV